MKAPSPLLALLIKYQASLVSRNFVLDYFSDAELMTYDEMIQSKVIRPGRLFIRNGQPHVVTEVLGKQVTSEPLELPEQYKLSFYQQIELTPGMIANHTEGTITTTLGVFLLNHNLLVVPFGDIIPYQNGSWKTGKIEDMIADKVVKKEIIPQQVFTYIDQAYAIGSLNDICVPTLSRKAITSNPQVDALRKELYEKFKDQLSDPNVMTYIENELIALDKELLKGDVSNGFLISGKAYNVQRKRMFLTMGLLEAFGEKGYNFAKTNLNEGWQLDELDVLANDIRLGSYSRAISTAASGAETKMLGRNFQDAAIVEDDCGTKRGLPITLKKEIADRFINRYIIEGNQLVLLTAENLQKYIGKQVLLRSPMYCASRNGYCYTCMDARFKAAEVKLLMIHPIAITSQLLNLSLKKMHGTKVDLLKLEDLNQFTI